MQEKISFIKSIPQPSISMTTQSLQSPNPFQLIQPQTTNVNPFSDMVNPFSNVIISTTSQNSFSVSNDQPIVNPFGTQTTGNPFL